jgi:hypothetical protein
MLSKIVLFIIIYLDLLIKSYITLSKLSNNYPVIIIINCYKLL